MPATLAATNLFDATHLPWIVAGAIVVFGLLIYGGKDVARFSLSRAWAISSVNFAESIRRRVLWLTPLAIVGVIIVSQLQHPVDEQDAIRQTTKFCLFACGLLVTVTGIILACTNLPREIESRVIYTVVTKPTTRLEIVLGKVIGFARVSATILLIMGIFSFGYLEIRAGSLRNYISQRLESGDTDLSARGTLVHYKEAGLLSAKSYDLPDDLQIYSRLPTASDDRRFMFGGMEGQFIVPFSIPSDAIVDPNEQDALKPLSVGIFLGYEKSEFEQESDEPAQPTTLPYYVQNPEATTQQVLATAARAGHAPSRPTIAVEILDQNLNTLVDPNQINAGKVLVLNDPEGSRIVVAPIALQGMAQLAHTRRDDQSPITAFIQISGTTPDFEFFARQTPVILLSNGQRIDPMRDPRGDGTGSIKPIFRTRTGEYGMQLRGGAHKVPMALFKFRDAPINPDSSGNLNFELKVGVERSTSDPNEDVPTQIEFSVIDRSAGGNAQPSQPITVYPETNRMAYISAPASLFTGPNFDIMVRALSPQQYVGVTPRALMLVKSNESFALNLFKSLLILWLLAILVVIVSVFCSTFLSWPIAIILTLVILLGNWGVQQLGDATAPGIGNMVVQDLFRGADANVARTVSTSVEALTKMLNVVSSVLPDITRFSALEDMERGVAVPIDRLKESAQVIILFGIPLIVLAYVLLRQKEVAP